METLLEDMLVPLFLCCRFWGQIWSVAPWGQALEELMTVKSGHTVHPTWCFPKFPFGSLYLWPPQFNQRGIFTCWDCLIWEVLWALRCKSIHSKYVPSKASKITFMHFYFPLCKVWFVVRDAVVLLHVWCALIVLPPGGLNTVVHSLIYHLLNWLNFKINSFVFSTKQTKQNNKPCCDRSNEHTGQTEHSVRRKYLSICHKKYFFPESSGSVLFCEPASQHLNC